MLEVCFRAHVGGVLKTFTMNFAADEEDIVEESIRLFRANVLFRNFEVKGGADRVLIYLTLFIHQVSKLYTCS
jgi:hypothetical protein